MIDSMRRFKIEEQKSSVVFHNCQQRPYDSLELAMMFDPDIILLAEVPHEIDPPICDGFNVVECKFNRLRNFWLMCREPVSVIRKNESLGPIAVGYVGHDVNFARLGRIGQFRG